MTQDFFGELDPTIMHQRYMKMALREAEVALEEGEVPVGAVVVHEGKIIGRGHNQRETLKDPTAHAEMIAITQASASLESWRLKNCSLYVTLEPCSMCSGALVLSRIPTLVYGAPDPRAGACGSVLNIFQESQFNHQGLIIPEILAEECRGILADFFRRKRQPEDPR